MQSIQIGARLDDEAKLLERAPTLGQSGSVGRQIPGNDDRSPRGLQREDSATPQVGGRIYDRSSVDLEVRVPAFRKARQAAESDAAPRYTADCRSLGSDLALIVLEYLRDGLRTALPSRATDR